MLPTSVRTGAAQRLGRRASPGNLRSLLRSLNDEDEAVRAASLESLVAIGSPSVPTLILGLMTDSSVVRARVAMAVGRFGSMSASVVPALEPLLRDASASVRTATASSLGEMGPAAASAVAGLARVTQGNEVEPTAAALKALGRIGPAARSSLPVIVSCLEHDDRTVRAAAAEAVGLIFSSRSGKTDIDATDFPPQLVQLLFHREVGVREAAARSCAAIGPAARAALPALRQQAQDITVSLRLAVVQALTRVGPGDPKTLPLLISLTQDKEWTIREAATRGFIAFGPAAKNAVPRLKPMLNDEYSRIRQAAIEAVGAIGEPARFLVDDLYARLFDKHEATRPAALQAFQKLAPCLSDFVPVLMQELGSVDVARRLTAIAVLKEFGDHAAVAMPRLFDCLYDNVLAVREAAAAVTGQPVPIGSRR